MREALTCLLRNGKYMKGTKTKYIVGLCLSSFEFVILFMTPLINQRLVDTAVNQDQGSGAMGMVFILLAILVLIIPFVVYGKYLVNMSTLRCKIEMRRDAFHHLQHLPLQAMGGLRSGEQLTVLSADTERVTNVFQYYTVITLVKFVAVTGVAVVVLGSIQWQVCLAALVYTLLCMGLAYKLNPRVRRLDEEARGCVTESSSALMEIMRGIPVIRIFLLKDTLVKKYTQICERIEERRKAYQLLNGIVYGILDFFTFSAPVLGFILCVVLMHDTRDLGSAVFAASLVGMMTEAMLDFSSFLLQLQPALVSSKRIRQILDMPIEEAPVQAEQMVPKGGIAIAFDRVSFCYDKERPVLQNTSFSIQKGDYAVFIGESGSGKSTICKLLQGFYTPSGGDIFYFGSKGSSLPLHDKRNCFGYVSQEAILFDGSIRQNITMGKQCYTEQAMTDAAKKANIHDFIVSLPTGYDTPVGERGALLSGGQKQRIALARAFLKGAPILLLDEMTSALDAESEALIHAAVRERNGETVISIVHKLDTIKPSDRIFLMEVGGAIREISYDACCRMKLTRQG